MTQQKSLNSLFQSGKHFHPEVKTRFPFNQLVGKNLILKDAIVLDDFNSGGESGKYDMAILYMNYTGKGKNGEDLNIDFTTVSSGKAIVNQTRKIAKVKYFPVIVSIRWVKQGQPNAYMELYSPAITEDDFFHEADAGTEVLPDLPF